MKLPHCIQSLSQKQELAPKNRKLLRDLICIVPPRDHRRLGWKSEMVFPNRWSHFSCSPALMAGSALRPFLKPPARSSWSLLALHQDAAEPSELHDNHMVSSTPCFQQWGASSSNVSLFVVESVVSPYFHALAHIWRRTKMEWGENKRWRKKRRRRSSQTFEYQTQKYGCCALYWRDFII